MRAVPMVLLMTTRAQLVDEMDAIAAVAARLAAIAGRSDPQRKAALVPRRATDFRTSGCSWHDRNRYLYGRSDQRR